MSVLFTDESLEEKLVRLGRQQPVRITKTRMTIGILEAAVDRCEKAGNPEAWRFDVAPSVNGSPLIPGAAPTPTEGVDGG